MNPETTQSTAFYEFLAWLEQNRRNLVIGIAVALVLGCAVAVYRWKSRQTELAATEALLQLRPPLNPAEKTPVAAAESYLKITSDFPNTDAAERASLLAAGAMFHEGKYAEALAQFDKFLQKHGSHPFAASAAYGRASSLEAQGKLEEALTAYQGIISQYPKTSLVDQTNLALARLYEIKNQPQMALAKYEELARPNANSPSSSEAMRRKEILLAKFPELAKTNSPPAATNSFPSISTNIPGATSNPALPNP
jgi:outer membrane protein assembly factor BamD (BamD/ComL family)